MGSIPIWGFEILQSKDTSRQVLWKTHLCTLFPNCTQNHAIITYTNTCLYIQIITQFVHTDFHLDLFMSGFACLIYVSFYNLIIWNHLMVVTFQSPTLVRPSHTTSLCNYFYYLNLGQYHTITLYNTLIMIVLKVLRLYM